MSQSPDQSPEQSSSRVVLVGLDTLKVGFRGEACDALLADVGRAQDAARESGGRAPVTLRVAGEVFTVGPPTRWAIGLLRSPDWTVAVTRPSLTRNPFVSIEPACRLLWAGGWRAAWDHARDLAAELGRVRGASLGRADLAVDVAGLDLRASRAEEWTTRADRRRVRGDERAGERFWERWTRGPAKANSLRFGGGSDLLCRAYDKVLEVREASGKSWFHDLWRAEAGVAPGTDLGGVWRVEFQCRRGWLRQWQRVDKATGEVMGDVDSAAGFGESLPLLWRVLVGGEGRPGWITWRSPTGHANPRRWPVRPEWRALQSVSWPSAAKPRGDVDLMRRAEEAATLAALTPGLAGYVARAAAITRESSLEGALALTRLLVEGYCERRGETWSELVARKARELTVSPAVEAELLELASGAA